MSESLWKYSAAPRCGTAAKTEPRISIYFNCSLVWNTTAGEHEGNSAPLLPTLTSFYLGFDEKLREEAMISSGEVKNTLHNSGAPTFQERFGSVDASTLPASFRILSLWSSIVCILFPLVRCWAVWPSASVHSQSLSSSFALSLSLPLQKRQIWRRSTEPTRAKMSRSEVDELIYFQRPFSRVQVNLAEPENLLAFVTLLNGPVANGDALLMRWICSVDSAPLLRGNSGEIFSVSELKTDT